MNQVVTRLKKSGGFFGALQICLVALPALPPPAVAESGFRSAQAVSPTQTPKPQRSAFVIPTDRLPLPGTWEQAGVEGGIPNRTAICANVTEARYAADKTGTISAVSAIQRAIDDCRDGQVVYVPAGTYKIDGRLTIQRSISLRGAGSTTVFQVSTVNPVLMQGAMPWPPPKNNAAYFAAATGTARGITTLTVPSSPAIRSGMAIMVDEEDDPTLVWTKSGGSFRSRGSMHLVEAKSGPTISFRPALPIDYTRSPRLSVLPAVLQKAGVEDIKFVGDGNNPASFIDIYSAWNVWVKGSEFSNMPAKTIVVAWSGHVELRKNYMHGKAKGGANSQGLDLLADVNWSLVVDNICSAGGFASINIGDGGASPHYSGGFGNVIAYNYCVDSFFTYPPTASNHGMMANDIGMHSPHPQYNLLEGNIIGKFGADAYHGSASHTVLFRNIIKGSNKWSNATNLTAIQIDRRNLHFSIVGNVLGDPQRPATREYATTSGWAGSTIFRLGFPDIGNSGFVGTSPPTPLLNANGGPRDLYVERSTTTYGTTLIEGNWNSVAGKQDWSSSPGTLPDSLFLKSKPGWFGDLPWPPVDPANPSGHDPAIVPAGYRFIHGTDPPHSRSNRVEQPRQR